jgi:hypothetical protein
VPIVGKRKEKKRKRKERERDGKIKSEEPEQEVGLTLDTVDDVIGMNSKEMFS